MSDQQFCPACGTDVEVAGFIRRGEEIPICVQCGLTLWDNPEVTPTGSQRLVDDGKLQNVLIAEDSELLRTVLADLFLSEGVADNVSACENGEEFLEAAARTMKEAGRIDLVVLDANMPILDGYRAALALRAMERGLEHPDPVPILFFTSVPCDETFKRVLERCAPARYVNKEAAPNPKELVGRIRTILSRLT